VIPGFRTWMGRVMSAVGCTEAYHDVLRANDNAWRTLRYVGEHKDATEHLELRNCNHCGSTLAVVTWRAREGKA
jgi:hypothetical protein